MNGVSRTTCWSLLGPRRNEAHRRAPRHAHHIEPCLVYACPDAVHCPPILTVRSLFSSSFPRVPRRSPGCHRRTVRRQPASLTGSGCHGPRSIRDCPVPARLALSCRVRVWPVRFDSVKAEPTTLNSGRKHTMTQPANTNRPVDEVRIGRVKATIWRNETEDGKARFNTVFSRLYKDGDAWQSTPSFGRNDLLLVPRSRTSRTRACASSRASTTAARTTARPRDRARRGGAS